MDDDKLVGCHLDYAHDESKLPAKEIEYIKTQCKSMIVVEMITITTLQRFCLCIKAAIHKIVQLTSRMSVLV